MKSLNYWILFDGRQEFRVCSGHRNITFNSMSCIIPNTVGLLDLRLCEEVKINGGSLKL